MAKNKTLFLARKNVSACSDTDSFLLQKQAITSEGSVKDQQVIEKNNELSATCWILISQHALPFVDPL